MAVDDEGLRRRMKAAQTLAGIKNVRELAERIDLPGLGRDTLYEMQSGKRPILRHELREIADACGVPVEFFTAEDFSALSQAGGGTDTQAQLDAIQQMLGNVLNLVGDDSIYADFVHDVRATVIPTAGEIQNELDAARLAQELPTQRLDQEAESPRARSTGRRQTR